MEELTISEVAQRAGIRPSAIRYYESVKVLPTPRRVSGQRRYDNEILRRLEVIQLAQELGFSIAEMRLLFDSLDQDANTPAQWQELARKKLGEVEVLIRKALKMKRLLLERLHCQCLNLHDCADCLLLKCGKANNS